MKDIIKLLQPQFQSHTSIEEAIKNRRSIRKYKNQPLKLFQISQLLWAAYGVTDVRGFHTSPSAGAIFPLEFYVVAYNVEALDVGVYKYNFQNYSLNKIKDENIQDDLCLASYRQPCIKNAMAVIVISGIYEKTINKYGDEGKKYVHMDVGHAAQNIYLQCESLGLGTVVAAGFDGDKVKSLVGMSEKETPLYVMPVGVK